MTQHGLFGLGWGLRRSYLQSILDCTQDPLFVTERSRTGKPEQRIWFINDAFSRLTGWAPADVEGKSPSFLFDKADESGQSSDLDAVFLRAEKSRLTVSGLRKDGMRQDFKCFINPLIENDQCRFVIAIVRPTTTASSDELATGIDPRLKAFADNLSEAILIHHDKQPLFVNAAYVGLFGYTSADAALREISPLMNLPLDGMAVGETIYCEALRTDGLPLFLALRKQPIDWNGRQATQLTITRDPRHKGSVPKRAKPTSIGPKDWQTDNTLLAEFLDALPLVLAHKSRDLQYTYVNKTYAEWVGLPREQIIGGHVSGVRNEAHYQLMKPRRDEVLSGKVVQYITKCEYPGRGMCDLFTTLIPRRDPDGTISGYFSMAQDITSQKEAERVLTRREEQLRLVMDSVPAMISYRDRNLCYRYVNKPYATWYGVRRQDMIGSYMTDFMELSAFRTLKPDIDRVLAGERFRQIYGRDVFRPKTPAMTVDYVPHEDENGNVIGFFALGQELKEAEDRTADPSSRSVIHADGR
jgi:PAS domain S-box-containing protein